jgi:AraC-like DNA-binding protein
MRADVERIPSAVGARFHQPPAPTLVALARPQRIPIVVSHVVSDGPMPDKTLVPPVEAAFAIHVHHTVLERAETWIDGKHAKLPRVAAGGLCIFDLRTSPVALIREGFAFSRFYLARTTLDDLAYEHGHPRVGELRIPPFGHHDPVIEHLAMALRERTRLLGTEVDSLFADSVALAFHAHVVRTYGEPAATRRWRGGLSPRRLGLVSEWMSDRLAEPLSIAAIAAQLGMAPRHFSRAFRESTGEPPHRWLMRRRIERAKELMARDHLALAEIASLCGFAAPSHFTRVFKQREKVAPAEWRRRATCPSDRGESW